VLGADASLGEGSRETAGPGKSLLKGAIEYSGSTGLGDIGLRPGPTIYCLFLNSKGLSREATPARLIVSN
jgi:hypothetical protein